MAAYLKISFAFLMVWAFVKGENPTRASAIIEPNCKQQFAYRVYGKVEMKQQGASAKTLINIKLEGLPPNTVHGFHIHEKGDIHTKGCGSAGGHYNPFGVVHGDILDKTRHVGDLGNIKADGEGKVSLTLKDRMVQLSGPYSVAGRAFVVHAMADDLGRGVGEMKAGSLTTGNAGARVACGIIYYS